MQAHALDVLRKDHVPSNYYVLMREGRQASSASTLSLTAAMRPMAVNAHGHGASLPVLDAVAGPPPLPRDAAVPLPDASLPGAPLPGPNAAAALMELVFEPDCTDAEWHWPLHNPQPPSFSAMDPSDPLVFKVLSLRHSIENASE